MGGGVVDVTMGVLQVRRQSRVDLPGRRFVDGSATNGEVAAVAEKAVQVVGKVALATFHFKCGDGLVGNRVETLV